MNLASITAEDVMALPDQEFKRLYSLACSRVALMRRKRPGRRFKKDSVAAKLAALKIGESLMFADWTETKRLSATDRRYACRRLHDTAARWSARLTNKGVRVTRVA